MGAGEFGEVTLDGCGGGGVFFGGFGGVDGLQVGDAEAGRGAVESCEFVDDGGGALVVLYI